VELTSSLHQIVKHTLPTLKKFKDQGLARYIGITGYNLGVLKKIIRMCEPGTIDTILIYGRCNLLNQGITRMTEKR
jgi:L-galactose dehydrogenase